MSWDFETEPDFQRELDWIEEFVRSEVKPLDLSSRFRRICATPCGGS